MEERIGRKKSGLISSGGGKGFAGAFARATAAGSQFFGSNLALGADRVIIEKVSSRLY